MRAITRADAVTTIDASILYDGGMVTTVTLSSGGALPVLWDRTWDRVWGASFFEEGDDPLVADLDRKPHRAGSCRETGGAGSQAAATADATIGRGAGEAG